MKILENLNLRSKQRKDGVESEIKTCLVVQGGGMRAAYSMGCLRALDEMGFSNSFDCVMGASAGAINGAYFISGQTKTAIDVYSNCLTNNKFINFFRIGKVMDVGYLIKILSEGETALDIEKIQNSNTNLLFTMIHYPSAHEKIISSKEKPSEIMNLIKASATIPAISNEKILIDGEKYIDGAIVDPIPIMNAIAAGYTDIVLVLTRSRKFRRRPLRLVYDALSLTYFKDWPKKSRDSLFERFSEVNKLYDFIWSHEGDNGSYRILVICPVKDDLAGLLSRNKKSILQNATRGYEDAKKILGSIY